MSKDFRDFEKESLELRVPVEVATKIREKALRERVSISRVGTIAIATMLGIDPARYGIEASAN